MRTLLLAAALLPGLAGLAMADTPGKDWISVDQAKAKLMAAGYTNVTTIKADDGHWEGVGVKAGAVHEFHVDPRSGAITKDQMAR